jgi:uroporphyrinogen-III synthase
MAPMLQIRALPARLPPSTNVQAVLVTSGNAIPSLPSSHRDLPLFAVGDATAAHARSAGFGDVHSADGDSSALASLVARVCDHSAGPLLLVSARGQGTRLAADLRARGFAVIRRVAYAAVSADNLPDVAREALLSAQVTAALFFSAETARNFVRLLRTTQLRQAVGSVDALAIGQRAAVALNALPWRRIHVATRPNQDAMLALLHE